MRMSQILTALANEPGERISVETILGVLSDRSFAILIVLLGLPNCLPMPPPIPAICALLLILVAAQMMAQRRSAWMPRALLARSVGRRDLSQTISRALPFVNRLERWSRPRLRLFGARTGAIVGGLFLALLALGMLSAAPLIGQVPYGIAVCLVGLGQVERDGLLVLFGVIAGVLGALLSAGFLYAVAVGVKNLL